LRQQAAENLIIGKSGVEPQFSAKTWFDPNYSGGTCPQGAI
jgi:hypothetical protein